LAYVAYKHPSQAALALKNVSNEPELATYALTISWHKKRQVEQEETKEEEDPLNEINVEAILQEFDLLTESPVQAAASAV